MATFENRARRDGKTSVRAKVRLKGARTVSASFPRLTDARKWAQQTEVAIQEGRYFKEAAAKRHTLAQAIERYTLEVLPRKPRSTSIQARQLAWWRKEIGHLVLADVTASAISATRAKLLSAPGNNMRKRGPATANRYMAALSHLFTTAVREWEWLEGNPVGKLAKLKEPRGRDRFLSEGECNRLLAACRSSTNPDLYVVVTLAISTGMRRNEILSLRYNQVDVDRGLIYLYDTKNGERRGVPLAGHALDLLRGRFRGDPKQDDLLFPSRTGCTPFDIRKPWYAAVKTVGLADLRFHDLRHTAASFLAKGGASLSEIGAVLRHKSAAMTKRYTHFAETHLRGVVEKMNEKLFDHTWAAEGNK